MKKIVASTLFTLLLSTSSLSIHAANDATQERAQSAINGMEMLFTGSWSKKVFDSKEDSVKTPLAEAEKARALAKEANEKGDYAASIEHAKKATNSFQEAAGKAQPQKSIAQRQEEEYKQRLNNTGTLMEAFDQAASDAQRQGSATKDNLNNMIQEAKQLAGSKKFKEANEILEKVSIAFKAIITSLMQGSTVTAVKDESPKGIYEYEIFRNDTYQSLIAMLKEKKLEVTQDSEFISRVTNAESIRKEAEAIGKKGEFETGSKKMEESTIAYKSAAKLAGIEIPD